MRPRLPLLLLALVTALAGASVSASARAGTAAVASVTLEGRGYGHGHGMSQYGAQGAAQQGLSYRQIMAFYYPGTSWGTAGGNVSVLISADTSTDVVVGNRSSLTARALGTGRVWKLKKAGATRWRLTPLDKGRDTRLSVAVRGKWHTVRTLKGQAQFSAGGSAMRLYYPGGSRAYRGVLRSAGGTQRDTVNVLALDTYLRGVVPQEMPALWKPAAVQSQAVAARTYAAYERSHPLTSRYQICDTSLCQVYGGASAEYPASDTAVKATAGKILTSGGKPAFTQFSASDGGWTTDGGFPYLPAKQDPYDGYGTWQVTLKAAAFEKAYPAIGTFTGLTVTKRDGNGAWGGRAVEVTIQGSRTTTTLTGDRFRSVFGLKSTLFHVL